MSYTGEVIEKAHMLTLEQVLPALPKPEHGGMVNLVDVVPPGLAESLRHPERLLIEDPKGIAPRPRVRCDEKEWPKIVKAMLERGLVRLVNVCPHLDGKPLVNGAFGVPKPGKVTESGLPVLRLIMDLRSTNWCMHQLQGDVATLTGAASFQRIMIQEDEELLISGEDLTSAFYLFRLPPEWANYMVMEREVCLRDLGEDSDEMRYVGISVLPMGWASAVGIMQAAHRFIALSSPLAGAGLSEQAEISRHTNFPDLDEVTGWSIYLDDTTILEKVAKDLAEGLEGRTPVEQERLRAAYAWWGIPRNPDKALERIRSAERLGALIDGKAGVLRTKTVRSLDLIGLGSYIRSKSAVARKALQVWAGKAVHILQFRRCMFSGMEKIFVAISSGTDIVRVTKGLVDEMLRLEAMLPLAQFDLRTPLDAMVTCSDASESGGGMCFASRLTWSGAEEARRLVEEGLLDPTEVVDPTTPGPMERILVVDLFAGIGGLGVALEKAGVRVTQFLIVEKDADCRRLLRRKYPGAEFLNDVLKCTREAIEKSMDSIPGITGVIVGGGSPCQGISRLSARRRHLEDPRSQLFFEAVRIFRRVEQLALERQIWCLKLLENVVADPEDIDLMSEKLRMRPVFIESGEVSRVRRPRMYWISAPISEAPGLSIIERPKSDQLKFEAPLEPLEIFVNAGCDWKAGSESADLRFPTFTRSIPRKRPPPEPAGIDTCDSATLQRWKKDEFRYPPYTYALGYMISESERLRPLKAEEREILMGFARGHTALLLKKQPQGEVEVQQAEDLRCGALGNSFHTNTVAMLLDAALGTLGLKERRGPQEIAQTHIERSKVSEKVKIELEDGEVEVATPTSDQGGDIALDLPEDGLSEAGEELLDEIGRRMDATQHQVDSHEHLGTALVSAFVRRQEFRGSDVRLDIGALYRPDSFPRQSINPNRWSWRVGQSYPFEVEEHINLLEMRALIQTCEWRLRSLKRARARFLHLVDSQVVLAVSVKGRSSSRALNRLLGKYAALQLAGGLFPLLAWVESELNPADAPSRRHA